LDSYVCRIGDNAWKHVRDFPEIQAASTSKQTALSSPKPTNGNGHDSSRSLAIQTPDEPLLNNGSSTVVAKIILTISVETSSSTPQIKVEVTK
jgi:hypothetical protein